MMTSFNLLFSLIIWYSVFLRFTLFMVHNKKLCEHWPLPFSRYTFTFKSIQKHSWIKTVLNLSWVWLRFTFKTPCRRYYFDKINELKNLFYTFSRPNSNKWIPGTCCYCITFVIDSNRWNTVVVWQWTQLLSR